MTFRIKRLALRWRIPLLIDRWIRHQDGPFPFCNPPIERDSTEAFELARVEGARQARFYDPPKPFRARVTPAPNFGDGVVCEECARVYWRQREASYCRAMDRAAQAGLEDGER